MLIGGSLAMLAMASLGGMMTNHGWREAQNEEIDAALRAGVSASAHFMRGNLATAEDDIKERVANFMRGLLGDITIAKDDIVISHDSSTNRTTIGIEGNARFAYKNLWATSGDGSAEPLKGEQVVVEFNASQFEFALALDISKSMSQTPTGWTVTRLGAMKDAIAVIAQEVDALSRTNPGIAALSLVPYSNVVNVAGTSGTSRTDAKERYVRMLTGAEYSTQTSRDTEGQWVDTFHSYGTGITMGPLQSRDLPDFLTAADWNMHQAGSESVTVQAPDVGTWSFRGQDFWNGCVMARWGAYWNPAARPVIWNPADSTNWPAKKTVAGWEPNSTSIADLPLHLSDAPPEASDPNTRFTAYSWPDARIHGFADRLLSEVMRATIEPGYAPRRTGLSASENHWHLHATDRGGALLCPEATIVPLTDDLTTLGSASGFDTVELHSAHAYGQTFLHLGIVWALRTLSPLWRDVWNTTSASGDALPRTPCLSGGTNQGCSQLVEKAIVIVSDGANFFGGPTRGRSFGGLFDPANAVASNPSFWRGHCDQILGSTANVAFRAAISAIDAAAFAGNFDVDATTGVFTATGLSAVLDGFQKVHPATWDLDPLIPAEQLVIDAHRALWRTALRNMTPWQLFRGYDNNSPSNTTDAIDILVDTTNAFSLYGRPAQHGHYCRPHTPFSAYGRADDLVNVGDGTPVEDVAPFSIPAWLWSSPTTNLRNPITDRLDDWFRDACDIAGRRGVRIHAVYIGGNTMQHERDAIALLEACVDRGYGSSSVVDEVYVAPTAQELKDAMIDIMDIRRTLRFVGA